MKYKLYTLFTFLFYIITYSQTGIGVYSVHDGGYENHTANLVGGNATNANLSPSLWTTNTTANIVRVLNATGGRSGPKYVSLGSVNGTLKNFYSPQIAGSFAPNTTYQIQFWYKSASTIALDASTVDLFVDNTSATQSPPIGTKQSVTAGLTTSVTSWTKVAVAITTDATVAGNFGVAGFTIDAATGGYSADIDDFVVYQASAPDTTIPNSPGAIVATGLAGGSANVNWNAATGGVDGGGYVVIRYATTAPSATDDPNQNGIYRVANTAGTGLVRYIGTNLSFTDTSLSPGVDYYYKVYTVDKAFNYSDESVTSTPVQSLATAYYYKGTGALNDVANWSLNTNGTGTSPTNFTDSSQVFEIRNTTSITLDGSWIVGTSPANGTKIRLGSNSQPPITLTLNPGASIEPSGTGNVDVLAPNSGNQTVIYKNTTAISFGNIFDENLAIIYDGVTVSSATTKNFGTVSVINAATLTFTATPIIKNINVDVSSTLIAPTSVSAAYITVPAGGLVVVNGTVRVPKLTGFVSSNVGTPNDTFAAIQFIGNENLTLGPNSTVEYLRNATGTLNITARTDYKNLILSGTTPKNINGPTLVSGTLTVNQTAPATAINLSGDVTVNGTLSFISGKITTGSNTLIIGNSGIITGASQSTGWIVGTLKKLSALNSSPTFNYTIGDSNNYTPLLLTFSGVTSVAGGVSARINLTDHPEIATSSLDSAKSVNKYWTLTNDTLTGFGTYSSVFTYTSADFDSGSNSANFNIRSYDGSTWSVCALSGTPSDTEATATSLSSFGDFAIAEIDALGNNNNNSTNYNLFPNPTKDGVLYFTNDATTIKSVEISDLLGKKVFQSNNITDRITIPFIKNGIYLAIIKSETATTIQKIVVQNN
jgi:hypothetical protein